MTLKMDGSFHSMCCTLEDNRKLVYQRILFIKDFWYWLLAEKNVNDLQKTEYQTDKQIIGKSMLV